MSGRVSVLNQSKHENARLNGFLETRYLKDLDRIDGEQMEFEWQISQDLHCRSSTRFKRWWLIQSVNQRTSKDGSSSCQCTWHWSEKTRKQRKLYCECSQRYWVCSKIHARTLVVSRAWIREEMVRNPCQQTWWRMRENCWRHDAQLCQKRTSRYSVVAAQKKVDNWKAKEKEWNPVTSTVSEDTIELIFHTVMSVNQLSVCGVVADLCEELAINSRRTGEPAATENLESMVLPTEFHIANPIAQTDAEVQGNLLREYEQKFAELTEQQKLTELCSNAGFWKNIERGQIFITPDDDAPDETKGSCRECTLPRSEESSRVRGWILGNTKIGPVVDVNVCHHQGRYGVELMIESLFRDRTVSWVRIVNGINK